MSETLDKDRQNGNSSENEETKNNSGKGNNYRTSQTEP